MTETAPDSPTQRIFRAISNDPVLLSVPSDRPFTNRPDQTAYEYARMAGATFRTRDDETNEMHLQHMSFLKRDVDGTLLSQHPLPSMNSQRTVEPPTKRIKLEAENDRSTPSTPTIKKKISLTDYKNKSAARTTSIPVATPPRQQEPAPAPEASPHPQQESAPQSSPQPPSEALSDRLKAFSPSVLLRSATAAMPSIEDWPIPLPRAVQAPKPVSKAAPHKPPKALSDRLQETGKILKRRYEDLNKEMEATDGADQKAKNEQQSLAIAVESVICFMRSFAEREKNGEVGKRLWPTLYSMLNLVAHKAKATPDVATIVGLMDSAVGHKSLMAIGTVKWEDMKDETARKEGWESIQKAIMRIRKADTALARMQDVATKYPRAVGEAKDLALTGAGDVNGTCRAALTFLDEWSKKVGVEWTGTCEDA